jgi:hypothetical protein
MNSVEELLSAAHSALNVGNRLVARGYLRRAANTAPERADIWRDLLEVTDLPADRMRCLERIIELDPSDAEAKESLASLRAQVVDAEAAADSRPPSTDAQDPEHAPNAAIPSTEQTTPLSIPPVLLGMRQDVTDEMREQWDAEVAAGVALHCIDHPHRETTLRCNRCGAPVCTDCIVRTPVGFRCRECVKAQQSVFFSARWYDYPVAALISLLLSIPAAALASMAGWWFAMIISPVAGGLIGGIVHWAIGRRRGQWIWLMVAVCMVVGALAALALTSLRGSFGLISIGIYAAMATGAAVGVLRLGRRR